MDLAHALGDALARAFAERGYASLTPVQEAVLAPEHAGRDLRVSSQTGSGKTIALGLAVRELVTDDASPEGNKARPRALVLVPTRELAKQVHEELAWLFAPLGIRVTAVTGGGGYRDELRAFRSGPAVVVGTPGRLRDHLDRGSLLASNVAAVVLDEADRMLDFGFREEIEAIVGLLPEDKRVHLVSATFPRDVRALADRVQRDPAHVMGTPLGAANQDIEHLVHLVHRDQRLDAIVNLLLADPGAQTLIFCHTRADVADLGAALADIGFVVATLSGEMEQGERNRALSLFKRGNLDAMVATDVAARGIDVADVSRVIHADPPNDADAYTHRSGRTGRAGRKGTSSVLVTPPALVRTLRTLERARVTWRIEPIPTADQILAARDEQLFRELTGAGEGASAETATDDADTSADTEAELPPRLLTFAERLLDSGDARAVVARLLARVRSRGPSPRNVTPIAPPAGRRRDAMRPERPERGERGERFERERPTRDGDGPGRRSMTSGDPSYRPFRVSWGQTQGADARRLLAVVCRRGNIRGSDVGAIRLAPTFSVVEVRADVAAEFERAAREPDPRAPRVQIRPWSEDGGPPPRGPRSDARAPRPVAADAPAARPHSDAEAAAPSAAPAADIPADRPSRARVPAERPSRARVPAERPSRARVPADRPSRTDKEERPAPRARDERPTRYGTGNRPGPAPRPSRDERPTRYGTGNRPGPAPRPSRDDRRPSRDSAEPSERPRRIVRTPARPADRKPKRR